MPTKNQKLIHALNTDPCLLIRQIKSYEARIQGINWTLRWHLGKGASETDRHVISLREDLLIAQNFLADTQKKLGAVL